MAGSYKPETVQAIQRRIARGAKSEAAVRKEYAELRKIANKRIERAGRELGNMPKFPTTKEMRGDAVNLAKELREVKKFLSSPRSTAAGRAETARKRVATLQGLGYTGVTERNEGLFNQFMEIWRRKYETITPEGRKMMMDSDFAVEIFDSISERFTDRTNSQSMGRMFNDYLRGQGMESLIKSL